MERKITYFRLILLLTFLFVIKPGSYAQVYQHNFGTANITTHPYTVAPAIIDPNLSGSSWTNSTSAWTNFGGSSGQAIALANSSGTPTITLTFNIAAGKTLDITSYNFWRQRSGSGAQNWTMAINGINVGSGTVPTSGAAIGTTAVTNPVNGLTGTVNVVLSLSGATGTGTFRLDDFTLNGTVNSGCTAPVITSFEPATGPANTLVSITGSGFNAGTTSVKFGGVESAGFTVVSDTEIKALVASTAVTGAVTVTTNACVGTSSTFTVISSNCPTFVGPTDLFISEVYDAEAGEGGAIELYNGTSATIDLSQYSLIRYGTINGAPGYTVNLTGFLSAGGVTIVRTNTSVCGLTGTPTNLLPSGFNDNDEFELLHNSVVIDNVHTPGNVGFSLIRNSNAQVPKAEYDASDWAISNNEDCSNLGIHSITSSTSDYISAQPLSAAVCEGEDVQYTVTLSSSSTFTYQWKMLNASGNWVNISDGPNFSGTTTTVLTIIDTPLEFNGAQFYCQATSAGCTLVSNAVQLTVSPLPLAVIIPVAPTCTIPTGGLLIVPSVGDGLTYSIDGINFQSGLAFNGIASGSYTLTIKSSANCVSIVPFTISPAPLSPVVATTTVVQPDCTTATGSITITNSVAGYTYSLDGSNFQSGTTFTGLAPGNYIVTTQGIGGCTSVTTTITINTQPTAPAVATTTVTQPDCTTATGSITITSPVGAGYSYSIDGTTFQNSPTFTGLTPGNYTVTTQSGACTSVTAAITINAVPVTPAVATTTVTQPTCTTPTGSIMVTGPTGLGFTYSIDGTNFQASPNFTNLAPGNYTITTQGASGCTSTTGTITLAVPAAPAVATTTVTQPTCTAGGSIVVTAPTGGQYTYSIDGTTFQASPTFANLAPGTYTVTTQNGAGCTSATATITINAAPAGPAVASISVIQPTCTAQGTITVTGPTGTGFTYSLDGTNFQDAPTFANLAPGVYTVTTKNNAGCTSVTGTITIQPVPNAPDMATTTITQPTCTTPTGSVTITNPTGTGITYSIDGTNFQAGTTFTGLTSGNYTVTTKNNAGCTSTAAITIDAVPTAPAMATTTVTQPTCSVPTGTIVVTAPTGSGLTYSIDGTNFQSSATFANLAPGNYTVTTQNTGGCTSTSSSITINNAPDAPEVATTTVTQPNCTGTTTGTIEITSPSGTGYTYSIDGTNFQASTTFAGLAPGNYTVTTDNGGCQSVSGTITINPVPTTPDVADTTATQPTCAVPTGTIVINSPTGTGYTYSIDGTNFQTATTFADLNGGAYIVTVMNAGGCTSTTGIINIDNSPVPVAATTDISHPTCFINTGRIDITAPTGSGFSYSIDGTNFQNGNSFINLEPGNYTITVMNISGCTSTTTVTINDVPETPIAASVTVVHPTCATGTGSITVTGPLGPQYSYSLDNITWQTGTEFAGLAPGNYEVRVQSNGGCKADETEVTLNEPVNDIVITGSQGCEGMSFESNYMLNASVTGADESNASFVWTNSDGATIGTGTTFNATAYTNDNPISPELYPLELTLTVTTQGGCTTSYNFEVDGTFCDIPRGISPNADNMNDNFDISGLNAKKLSIYNRYGEEIYSKANYTNEWYGQTDNGDEVPTGTYFYVIEHAGQNRTGWVYVNREQ